MKKFQNMSNLSFDNSYFYRLIHKEENILLLQDPVETDRYVFKIKEENKGQMIDRRNNDELIPVVADYLKACKSVAEDIRKKEFDLKIEDNLITIAQEYQSCK